MNLIINNKVITAPIIEILKQLKSELKHPYFKNVVSKGKNIVCTCPHHKDGQENHPSCNIFNDMDDPNVEYGWVKCFSCGYNVPLYQMINDCFGEVGDFGKEWLVERFGDTFMTEALILPEITLNKQSSNYQANNYDLSKYDYYHDYMWTRHLTKEVVDKYRIGFDPETNCLTFPVWDENDRLVLLTKRSVSSKHFYIEENKDKPVYLLNFMLKEHKSCLYIAESQINALTLQSWGYPGVALFGTGSEHQYDILRKCGIRNFILCFDGDKAGELGANRFIKNIGNNVFITIKKLPFGKDINDLTKEEFDKLPEI